MATETLPKKEGYIPYKRRLPIPEEVLEPEEPYKLPELQPAPA